MYKNFTKTKATANKNSPMGSEPIQKHGRSSKSHTSRVNFLRTILIVAITGFGMSIYAQSDECTITSCGLTVTCFDYPKILTYDEALAKCPSGYRLPAIDELLCLAQNKSTLHLRDLGEYWSRTTTRDKVYTVTMNDGKDEQCEKDEKKWVRYIKDKAGANYEALNQLLQAADKPFNNNYALLHFYRPGMFYGSGVWYNLCINGKDVWKAKNGRKITIKLTKEGSITVHARDDDAKVTFDVQFGKEYYIECVLGTGAWSGYPIITLKDESIGYSMFRKITKDDTTE